MWPFFSYFYPKIIRDHYIALFKYFNIEYKEEYVLGVIFVLGTSLSLIISFLVSPYVLTSYSKYVSILIVLPVLFFLVQFIIYYFIYMVADRNGRFVEDILPDALQLMASNLRAGMTIDRALLVSTRKEFGPFNRELIRVGKEITTGKEIAESLRTMNIHIKSEKLRATVELLILGLRSGGELSQLLEQVSENLRQQRLIEEKIKASVTTYVIFIFSAVCLGTPVLFGLSTFLIRVITKNLQSIEVPETTGRIDLPFHITEIHVSPSFIVTFAIVTLVTSSVMAGFVIGLIKKGKERAGIQYIPLFLAISLTVFLVVRWLVTLVFGSIIG